MSYPSIEVSQKTVLRHVVLPGGIRLMTWQAATKKDETGKTISTVGYALYPQKKSEPIMNGYCECDRQDLDTDRSLLDLLGTVFFANWTCSFYEFYRISCKEYSEAQIDWLSSEEINDILDILDNYEEEAFDDVEPHERGYIWKNHQICAIDSLTPLFKDVNLN